LHISVQSVSYSSILIQLDQKLTISRQWEAEIGTDSGRVGSKKLFSRKIDPIANGISDMTRFEPTQGSLTELPTAVMLSNIQTIKDVKAAVLAADHIINDFGFKDYRLHIYGAQDREPAYTMATLQIIADRNLTGKVVLAGFGDPKKVLKDAWLFVNSSLSEGLPLSIGEAALTGVPIVATEVGGTSLVLTDPDDKTCKYGEVVPPNDPMALARAQINVLAMMGQWASYTDDKTNPPILPNEFTPEDVETITRRMHEKTEDRRKLGLKCREVVLRSFHGNRYLREHEQMYWVQWHIARIRAQEELQAEANVSFRFGIPQELRCDVDESDQEDDKESAALKPYLWRDFDRTARRRKGRPRSTIKRNEEKELQRASARTTSLEFLRADEQKGNSVRDPRTRSDTWTFRHV
jgi:glycosyltransferase involved in cell wall biosynthesis